MATKTKDWTKRELNEITEFLHTCKDCEVSVVYDGNGGLCRRPISNLSEFDLLESMDSALDEIGGTTIYVSGVAIRTAPEKMDDLKARIHEWSDEKNVRGTLTHITEGVRGSNFFVMSIDEDALACVELVYYEKGIGM